MLMLRASWLLLSLVVINAVTQPAMAVRTAHALTRSGGRSRLHSRSVVPSPLPISETEEPSTSTALVEVSSELTLEQKKAAQVLVAGIEAFGAFAHSAGSSGASIAASAGSVTSTLDAVADGVIIAKAALTVINVIVQKFVNYYKQKEELRSLKMTVENIRTVYEDQLEASQRIQSTVWEAVKALGELSQEDQRKIAPKVNKVCRSINLRSINRVMASIKSKLEHFSRELDDYNSRYTFTKWLWSGTYLEKWRSIHQSLVGAMAVFSSAQNVAIQNGQGLREELQTLENPETGALLLEKLGGAATSVSRMKDGFERLAKQVNSVVLTFQEGMSEVKDEVLHNRAHISELGSKVDAVKYVVDLNQRYLKGLSESFRDEQLRQQTHAAIGMACNRLEQESKQTQLSVSHTQQKESSDCRMRLSQLSNKIERLVDSDKSNEDILAGAKEALKEGNEAIASRARGGVERDAESLLERAMDQNRLHGVCELCQSFFDLNPSDTLHDLDSNFGLAVDRFLHLADNITTSDVQDVYFGEYIGAVDTLASAVTGSYASLMYEFERSHETCIGLGCQDDYEQYAKLPVCSAMELTGNSSIAVVSKEKLDLVESLRGEVTGEGFWSGKTTAVDTTHTDLHNRVCSVCCEGIGKAECATDSSSPDCKCTTAMSPVAQALCPGNSSDSSTDERFDCSGCGYAQCSSLTSPTKTADWDDISSAYEHYYRATKDELIPALMEDNLREIKKLNPEQIVELLLQQVGKSEEPSPLKVKVLSEAWVKLVRLAAPEDEGPPRRDPTFLVNNIEQVTEVVNAEGRAASERVVELIDRCFAYATTRANDLVDSVDPPEQAYTHSRTYMDEFRASVATSVQGLMKSAEECGPLPQVWENHSEAQVAYVERMKSLRRDFDVVVSNLESTGAKACTDVVGTKNGFWGIFETETYITGQKEFRGEKTFPANDVMQAWKDGFAIQSVATDGRGYWRVIMSKYDREKMGDVHPVLGVKCTGTEGYFYTDTIAEAREHLSKKTQPAVFDVAYDGKKLLIVYVQGCANVSVQIKRYTNGWKALYADLNAFIEEPSHTVLGGTRDIFLLATYDNSTSFKTSDFRLMGNYWNTITQWAEGFRFSHWTDSPSDENPGYVRAICQPKAYSKNRCKAQQTIVHTWSDEPSFPRMNGQVIQWKGEDSMIVLQDSSITEQSFIGYDADLIKERVGQGWVVTGCGGNAKHALQCSLSKVDKSRLPEGLKFDSSGVEVFQEGFVVKGVQDMLAANKTVTSINRNAHQWAVCYLTGVEGVNSQILAERDTPTFKDNWKIGASLAGALPPGDKYVITTPSKRNTGPGGWVNSMSMFQSKADENLNTVMVMLDNYYSLYHWGVTASYFPFWGAAGRYVQLSVFVDGKVYVTPTEKNPTLRDVLQPFDAYDEWLQDRVVFTRDDSLDSSTSDGSTEGSASA